MELINKYKEKFKRNNASKKELDNLLYIIDYAKKYGCNKYQIAYILATAYHESYDWKKNTRFIPIREFGTRDYFIKKYFINPIQRKWLGNDNADEAVKYCGRGLVQITGENNYEKFGIANNPEIALEIEKSTEILVKGMMLGLFTGAKLSKYINNQIYNPYNARRVVNGLDKALDIMHYSDKFYDIL